MKLIVSVFQCFVIFRYIYFISGGDDHLLDSKAQAEQMEKARCGYKMMKLWTAEIAHSPFAAAPLITDVDADGNLDIVAAPLSESHTVVVAETGRTLPNSRWPAQKLDSSFLSSPLQYDINGDGMLDLLFVTSSGDLLFYTSNGTILRDYSIEIPPIHVKQDWNKKVMSASGPEVQQFVTTDGNVNKDRSYLPVDAHVLASPVIADINGDGKIEEMVVPVSYFFDEEDYRLPENFLRISNINSTELQNYVVSGIVIVNLSTMRVDQTIVLDLTTKHLGLPAYVMFSPTVIDMDRNGGYLEIIIGTSAGNVHVIDVENEAKDRQGFPHTMDSVHGQVTAVDINKDRTIELIAIDTSGNVVCLNEDGTLNWEAKVSGTSSPGSRLTDVDGDGYLDVIVATNTGDVYAFNGVTGSILDRWPIKTGHSISSNVLITKISRSRQDLDMVFLSNDGALHVISLDLSCRTHFPVGETSLVQILSHDLVVQSDGFEVLISTNDGTLICMGTGDELTDVNVFEDSVYRQTLMLSLPTETKSLNDFVYSKEKLAVFVREESRRTMEVTGSTFIIQFEIIDPTYKPESQRNSQYSLKVYFGRHELFKSTYSSPSAQAITVTSYPQPSHGHITLVLTNSNGQVVQDMFPIRFNQVILEDLQWLLMAPFVTMVIILLVIHGFPAKDLLPVTHQSKKR